MVEIEIGARDTIAATGLQAGVGTRVLVHIVTIVAGLAQSQFKDTVATPGNEAGASRVIGIVSLANPGGQAAEARKEKS